MRASTKRPSSTRKAGRYLAGSVDGQPTTDCLVFRVKFELKN